MVLEKEIEFAEKFHKTQKYGDKPYIYHLLDVQTLAMQLGYDKEIQQSCILHDVLEDTECTFEDLAKEFGSSVAEIVYCVTDEDGGSRFEKKQKTYPKIKNNHKATIVKLLDRICNIRECYYENNNKKLKMYADEHLTMFESIKNEKHPKDVLYAWTIFGKWFSLDQNINFNKFLKTL